MVRQVRPDALSQAIASIYDAGADKSLWPSAILKAGALIGAHGGSFQMHRRGEHIASAIAVTDFDPALVDQYFSYYQYNDPWLKAWTSTIKPNIIAIGDDLCPREEIEASETFQESYRRLDIYDTCVLPFSVGGHNAWATLNCGKSKIRYGAHEKKIAALLIPHFQRALGFQERFNVLSRLDGGVGTVLDQLSFAVFVIRSDRRVLFANAAGDKASDAETHWRDEGGRFFLRDLNADTQLAKVLRSVCANTYSPRMSSIELHAHPTRIAVAYPMSVPTGPFAQIGQEPIVVIYFPPSMNENAHTWRVHEQFSLSPAEAELAQALVTGSTLAEFSQRNNISNETARWRLKRVFEKVGVSRQADLVRLFLTAAPPIR